MRSFFFLSALALVSCTVRRGPDDGGAPPDVPSDAPLDGSPDAPPDTPPDAGPAPVILVEDGAPADAPDLFDPSAPSTNDLALLYPRDGVLLPPNLGGLEIHLRPARYDVYELRFEQAGRPRVIVYDDCAALADGCTIELSDAAWTALADARGEVFTLVVHGRDRAGGGTGAAPPIELELADEPVTGGLYFWSTDPPAIHRYDFDRGHRVSEVFYDEVDSGGRCVGCHALSRDGATIAVGLGTEGPIGVLDVATRVSSGLIDGEMAAFSPDGLELVVGAIPEPLVASPLSVVRTDGTGTPLVIGEGASPDWSPDGMTLAATTPEGSIALWDLTGGTWTARATTLTPGEPTGFDGFPSFAPDSDWIVFSRETPSASPGGSDSRIWAVGRDGAIARPLAIASAGTYDSMPRWSPATFLHEGRRLYWLTFTSNLDYGLVAAGRQRRIWMAAFAPGSTEPDPSRPAFLLPGQPETGSSFIPQWTSEVLRQVCTETSDCRTGELCDDGVCVPDLM